MGVKLTIATTDYDHFRDFRLGAVAAEGIEPTWLTLGHHEVFARFTFNREWEVSELSFAKFCAQVTRDAPDIIGLPVVCSRLFRFSSFWRWRRPITRARKCRRSCTSSRSRSACWTRIPGSRAISTTPSW